MADFLPPASPATGATSPSPSGRGLGDAGFGGTVVESGRGVARCGGFLPLLLRARASSGAVRVAVLLVDGGGWGVDE